MCSMSFAARFESCFQSYDPLVQKPGHGDLFVRADIVLLCFGIMDC